MAPRAPRPSAALPVARTVHVTGQSVRGTDTGEPAVDAVDACRFSCRSAVVVARAVAGRRHDDAPPLDPQRPRCRQAFGAHERVAFERPLHVALQSRIDQLARLAADERPLMSSVRARRGRPRRHNPIGAVGGDDGAAVFQFEERHQRRHELFDRRGESRQARAAPAGSPRHRAASPVVNGSAKRVASLPDQPDAGLPPGLLEELEARDRRKRRRVGNRRHAFGGEPRHQPHVRIGELAERARGLLPLAIDADVGEVAAPEIEQRQQVASRP